MRPPNDKNFCRVFELPAAYPTGFCFGGGRPVQMQMVDWFNPWPDPQVVPDTPDTWEELVPMLKDFLLRKNYVKPGKRFILITDFNECFIFSKGDNNGQPA